MVTKVEESLCDQITEQFKEDLIEDGIYAEGQVENEVELEALWENIKAKHPELGGRMGILLISKVGLGGVPESDTLKLIESITNESI